MPSLFCLRRTTLAYSLAAVLACAHAHAQSAVQQGSPNPAVAPPTPVIAPKPTGATMLARPTALLTQHNNNARTGANLTEIALNKENVNAEHFGKLFARDVDGQVYAQPLYVPNLKMPGKGVHNVLFVATEHNSVYAYDADDPKAKAPFWTINLGPSVSAKEVYITKWTDMNEEIGITSTPVIDPNSGTIYVVAKTKEEGKYFQRLHALSIATGKEMRGSPMTITATIPGKGYDAVDGKVSFGAFLQLQRPGLLLSKGLIYLGFGAHADRDPFHGWIMAYDAKTLRQVSVLCTTPDGAQGSIWQAGQGLSADESGSIYAVTGNGTADAQTGGRDYGTSILRLVQQKNDLVIMDWFTPSNFEILNEGDTDLGSSGPLLVPGTDLLISGGKSGVAYTTKRSNLGHFAEDDKQMIQRFQMGAGHIHGSPIYYDDPKNGPTVYTWSEEDHLKAFSLKDGKLNEAPIFQSEVRVPGGMPGGFLSISANGKDPMSGIVWASRPLDDNANWRTVDGMLEAYDASDLTHKLWDTQVNAARDGGHKFAKFCPPTIVNGKVYLATFSKQVIAFGLLPAALPKAASLSTAPGATSATLTATVTLAAAAPAGGAVVTIASSDSAAAKTPAYVRIPAGATTAPFPVTLGAASAKPRTATITATSDGAAVTAVIKMPAKKAARA
ncbi:MAG: Fibronectin type domain [Capsulimonas sp.]|nr:Fibronectin type domain [Capsulimonas sp.]